MATTSDIEITPLSGLNHIDALLDKGPDWNYLSNANNTIRYTFSTASGNEAGQSGQQAFNATQQGYARAALALLTSITGINFVESAVGTTANLHFAYIDIPSTNTSGLASWASSYGYTSNNTLTTYTVQAYVYLDNTEFGAQNSNLAPGGFGYQTILHELGHAMGLKHPFEDAVTLPGAQDNTSFTLMSYKNSGGPYSTYSPYDVAALNWLYGGDGFGGALGIGSTTGGRYITGTAQADSLTGTSSNDTLRGNGGNDTINGGGGEDTAIFSGNQSEYTIVNLSDGRVQVNGTDGVDTLSLVEILQFASGSVRTGSTGGTGDTTAPAAPTLNTVKSANGYVAGSTPLFTGTAEANALVKVFSGATLLGSATANASGVYSIASSVLADSSYVAFATATDAAGNVSGGSTSLSFNVDIHAPAKPALSTATDGAGVAIGNQPLINGTAEAGSTVVLSSLYEGVRTTIAQVQVGANSNWSVSTSVLGNGAHSVSASATDAAGNVSELSSALNFTVASSANRTGTGGNDSLFGTTANNAFNGGAGVDTVIYGGARGGFSVLKAPNGYTVTGPDGSDLLLNVERVQFGDGAIALDIDGNGGKAYRIYKAAFDRTPDQAGVGFWIKTLDQGQSMNQVANGFLSSKEFSDLYGANSTDLTFVTKLYANVLHRAADGAGFDYWINILATHAATRADVLSNFSESGENQLQVIGQIENGFQFIPYL